jgi:conjugative relaxase-like TrwC/TraI family protein
MVTLSKPLSSGQAQAYHREEFTNAQENYYTDGDRIRSAWHGQLAAAWGLRGDIDEAHFARLADGRHPMTGEALVRHQTPRTYVNDQGGAVHTMEHRAGWDATFSAPKSVSLTALVGGVAGVRQAHEASVTVALDALERYTQARIGGNEPAETTGQWVAARFEHDSARPVDGYAAPQLHTHVVIFNLTETRDGETHALQPHELYRSQQYATAIYRSELARRLHEEGYAIERGSSGQPEIAGYTPEYLERSSPRRRQIEAHLAAHGVRGAGAAEFAAHQTREDKLPALTHAAMQQRHQALAAEFGDQPAHVVEAAQARAVEPSSAEQTQERLDAAVTYARDRNFERTAVVDERDVLRDALKRSMGEANFAQVRHHVEQRVRDGALIEVESASPARTFTTEEMISYERETVAAMRAGQQQHEPLVRTEMWEAVSDRHPHLSASQRAAVEAIITSRDRILGLEGVAGAGKTTSLAALRDAAEHEGYDVRGLAPTSRAAQKLAESGIEAETLQRHLRHDERPDVDHRRLYVVDESSLASTKQLHTLLHRLQDDDRVLFVGDTRQHEAVEAGRPYQQLQEAGMHTARLDEILRQQDASLKVAVEQLARGDIIDAIQNLDGQGRVHEIVSRDERLTAIACDYARDPHGTLVISPDNASRRDLNELIHRELQARGAVSREEHTLRVLDARQDMTGADRRWAGQYDIGDVVRYTRGSNVLGLEPGECARVTHGDPTGNRVTVARATGEEQTYDPRRLAGVAVYHEVERTFAIGDRVQFTAPSKDLNVANRELGTIDGITDAGTLRIRTDAGREVVFNVREHPHLDHGYAVTSHSSQGQTADRVLVHVDTEQSARLVNRRLAYVSVSRGRYDAVIYTNDKAELAQDLSRDVSQRTATEIQPSEPVQAIEPVAASQTAQGHDHGQAQSTGHGIPM